MITNDPLIIMIIPITIALLLVLPPNWIGYYFCIFMLKKHSISYTEFEKMYTNQSEDTFFELDKYSFVVNFSKINNESNKKEQKNTVFILKLTRILKNMLTFSKILQGKI